MRGGMLAWLIAIACAGAVVRVERPLAQGAGWQPHAEDTAPSRLRVNRNGCATVLT